MVAGDLGIEILDDSDNRTYGDVSRMPEGPAKDEERRRWESAGVIDDSKNPNEGAKITSAFINAWSRWMAQKKGDTIPDFKIEQEMLFLAKMDISTEVAGGKVWEIKTRIVPANDNVTFGQLKQFKAEVQRDLGDSIRR